MFQFALKVRKYLINLKERKTIDNEISNVTEMKFLKIFCVEYCREKKITYHAKRILKFGGEDGKKNCKNYLTSVRGNRALEGIKGMVRAAYISKIK